MNQIARDYITENNGEFVVRPAAGAQSDRLREVMAKFFSDEGAPQSAAGAADAIALDKDSIRTIDDVGRMHVAHVHISKATVNPYYGKEIPNFEKLGLDPERIYQLFRDPVELEKAVSTFDGIQVLIRHIPVTAAEPQTEEVVGATGTTGEFNAPYLDNELVIWTKAGIDAIESGAQRELSCGYAYTPVMEPGVYDGQPYDGRMTDIKGNHVALVSKGRAGPDVVVGDSALDTTTTTPMEKNMVKHVLTRKAAIAQGAVLAHLIPLLAADAAMDFGAAFAPITAKNFKEKRQGIIDAMKPSLKLKAGTAMDAALKAIGMGLDQVEPMEVEEGADLDPNSGLPMSAEEMRKKAEDDHPLLAELEGKVSPEIMARIKECLDGSKAMDGDKRKDGESDDDYVKRIRAQDAAKGKDAEPEPKPALVTKEAMDKQIATSVSTAVETERKRSKDAAEARQFVEPWVGKVSLAHDSAEDIYRSTLGMLGVKHDAVREGAALKILVEAQPKPNARRAQDPSFANDAAPLEGKAFTDMFPGAERIGTAA
jgi:hypothetical protein